MDLLQMMNLPTKFKQLGYNLKNLQFPVLTRVFLFSFNMHMWPVRVFVPMAVGADAGNVRPYRVVASGAPVRRICTPRAGRTLHTPALRPHSTTRRRHLPPRRNLPTRPSNPYGLPHGGKYPRITTHVRRT